MESDGVTAGRGAGAGVAWGALYGLMLGDVACSGPSRLLGSARRLLRSGRWPALLLLKLWIVGALQADFALDGLSP